MRLRYIVELGINCLTIGDFDGSMTSAQDQLRLLERYQDGWDSISYDRRDTQNAPLAGGWRIGMQFCQWNWVCYCVKGDSGPKIVLSRLPSTLRGITESVIVSHKLDFSSIKSFAVDPFSNLLAFAETVT